jgi:hypothetical protein
VKVVERSAEQKLKNTVDAKDKLIKVCELHGAKS